MRFLQDVKERIHKKPSGTCKCLPAFYLFSNHNRGPGGTFSSLLQSSQSGLARNLTV